MAHTEIHMRIFFISLLLSSLFFGAASARASERYAVANLPTPMFNVSGIGTIFGGADGATLATDNCGQLRQLEFIALPRTVFTVTETLPGRPAPVYRVTTADYPYPSPGGYFIDSRFVTLSDVRPPERPRRLPSRQSIAERLLATQGSIYVWGGNVRSGIGEMSELYPAGKGAVVPELVRTRWNLKGVDCSGLLYEATDGFTPRNTSALVSFGRSVPIEGLATAEIVRRVEPLDLIVWKGHVLIILDRERVIESYLDCAGTGGVRVRPLAAALDGIRKKRSPYDVWPAEKEKQEAAFVIRRWYPPVSH
jgi:hypothetical protein